VKYVTFKLHLVFAQTAIDEAALCVRAMREHVLPACTRADVLVTALRWLRAARTNLALADAATKGAARAR